MGRESGHTEASAATFARSLRRGATGAEKHLWRRLRDRRLVGWKFRRQHPMGPYVVDFYCPEARLVVEIDGSQHLAAAAYDARRSASLARRGMRVLRFWNHDVLLRTDSVLEAILQALEDSGKAPPHP